MFHRFAGSASTGEQPLSEHANTWDVGSRVRKAVALADSLPGKLLIYTEAAAARSRCVRAGTVSTSPPPGSIAINSTANPVVKITRW